MKFTDFLQDSANFIFTYVPQSRPTYEQASSCKIVAHRGAWNMSDCLENTTSAFDSALRAGVWAIEFDIRWTKDNIPIVHHDKSTQRVFKKNIIIEEIDFYDLRKMIPLIPRLDEIVHSYAQKVHFMIELKESLTYEQEQILFNILKPLKEITDYHFMCLHLDYFHSLTSFNPMSFVAIGRGDLKTIHQQSLKIKIGALTGHYSLFNNSMNSTQHNLMRQTGVGFPTSKNGLYREIHRGFDWIFTNKAAHLQKQLDSLLC